MTSPNFPGGCSTAFELKLAETPEAVVGGEATFWDKVEESFLLIFVKFYEPAPSHNTVGRSAACAAINFAAAFGYCRGNHERGDALRQRKFHHDWQLRGRAPNENAQARCIGAPMALL